jgi:hypothetical protein
METGKNLTHPGCPCGTIQEVRLSPAATSVAAVDEVVLPEPLPWVNISFEDFSK